MSVAKSVKYDILLESWVKFSVWASLKDFETHWSSLINIVYGSAHFLNLDVLGLKAQL